MIFCRSPQCRPSAMAGKERRPSMPVEIKNTTIAKAKADAKPGGRRYDIVDAKSRGLSLRVSPTGVQWSLRFQLNGRDKRLALGDVDLWTIPEARSLTDRAQGMIRDRMGIPDEVWLDRMRQREGKVAEVTLVERPDTQPRARFKWTYAEGRKAFLSEVERSRSDATFEDYRQKLSSDDMAALERQPLPNITRRDLSAILAAIARTGRESTAEGTQRVLSRFWNWLSEDAQINNSGVQPGVMAGLKAPERVRVKPVLDENGDEEDADDPYAPGYVPPLSELGRVIALARSRAIHPTIGAALELTCWTSQRRRTIVEARVQDFVFISDEIGGLWQVPSTKMKGGRPHVIPLPPQAWALWIRVMTTPRKPSAWMFPQIRAKAKGMPKSFVHRSTLTHNMGWMPGVEASPHDIRRAFATHGESELKMLRADTEAILAHKEDRQASPAAMVLNRGEQTRGVTAKHYALHNGTHRTWDVMRTWCAALEPEIEKAIAALEPVSEIKAAMRVARRGQK